MTDPVTALATSEPAATPGSARRDRVDAAITIAERLGIFAAWIVVIIVFGAIEPSTFLTLATVRNIMGSNAVLVILGLGLVPSLAAAEFFLFLNTGPLNTAIVNSVSAKVRATAVGLNLFIIHCFGDTFSPVIIGAISDRSNLHIGLGATLIFLVISCCILWAGSRVAPLLEEVPAQGTDP